MEKLCMVIKFYVVFEIFDDWIGRRVNGKVFGWGVLLCGREEKG